MFIIIYFNNIKYNNISFIIDSVTCYSYKVTISDTNIKNQRSSMYA